MKPFRNSKYLCRMKNCQYNFMEFSYNTVLFYFGIPDDSKKLDGLTINFICANRIY